MKPTAVDVSLLYKPNWSINPPEVPYKTLQEDVMKYKWTPSKQNPQNDSCAAPLGNSAEFLNATWSLSIRSDWWIQDLGQILQQCSGISWPGWVSGMPLTAKMSCSTASCLVIVKTTKYTHMNSMHVYKSILFKEKNGITERHQLHGGLQKALHCRKPVFSRLTMKKGREGQ